MSTTRTGADLKALVTALGSEPETCAECQGDGGRFRHDTWRTCWLCLGAGTVPYPSASQVGGNQRKETANMEISNGKLRISAGYSLKIPSDVPYSSSDKHTGISLEFDVEDGADIEAIMAQALELESKMDTQVKLATFASLNVEFDEVAKGVLVPILNESAPAKAAPPRQQKAAPARNNGGGGGQQQRTPPKANQSDIPTFDGPQGETLQDLRDLKANGTYKPNAPDFREPGQGGKAYWPANNGKPATEGYDDVAAYAPY